MSARALLQVPREKQSPSTPEITRESYAMISSTPQQAAVSESPVGIVRSNQVQPTRIAQTKKSGRRAAAIRWGKIFSSFSSTGKGRLAPWNGFAPCFVRIPQGGQAISNSSPDSVFRTCAGQALKAQTDTLPLTGQRNNQPYEHLTAPAHPNGGGRTSLDIASRNARKGNHHHGTSGIGCRPSQWGEDKPVHRLAQCPKGQPSSWNVRDWLSPIPVGGGQACTSPRAMPERATIIMERPGLAVAHPSGGRTSLYIASRNARKGNHHHGTSGIGCRPSQWGEDKPVHRLALRACLFCNTPPSSNCVWLGGVLQKSHPPGGGWRCSGLAEEEGFEPPMGY